MAVSGMYVLDGLAMLVENVDPNHSVVELRIGGLDDLIVFVVHIVQGIKSLQHKLKGGLEILRAWRGDKDVGVAGGKRNSYIMHI